MSKTVNTLILRGPSPTLTPEPHVYVSSAGVLSTGDQREFPKGAFVIQVATSVTDADAFHASLTRIVRNTLSAYPIVDIQDGGGLPFDLKGWLRENRQAL